MRQCKESLMRADSPRGTWAISEAGRRVVVKQEILPIKEKAVQFPEETVCVTNRYPTEK